MTVAGQTGTTWPPLVDLGRVLGFFASVIKSGEPWSETCQREYEAANSALQAVYAAATSKPVVKALEWNKFERSGGTVYADTLFGRYSAWDFDGQDGHWKSPSGNAGVRVDGGIEAAKAAAQSHHDALIRSALGEHP